LGGVSIVGSAGTALLLLLFFCTASEVDFLGAESKAEDEARTFMKETFIVVVG